MRAVVRVRTWLLRWSQHECRKLPATTPVQYDLPCRCGWHVTGLLQAPTDGEILMRIGAPMRVHDLSGPIKMMLDHYDICPARKKAS